MSPTAALGMAAASSARRHWLWALCGVGDALAGIALIGAPAAVLELLGTPAGAPGLLAWRWVGVFVLAVGVLYVYPLRGAAAAPWRLAVLAEATALVRGAVALFVVTAVAARALPAGWLAVALTDGAIAAGQLVARRRGWPGTS